MKKSEFYPDLIKEFKALNALNDQLQESKIRLDFKDTLSEHIYEMLQELLSAIGALEAGIPESVVRGKTNLSDHFSKGYINYKCNKGESK